MYEINTMSHMPLSHTLLKEDNIFFLSTGYCEALLLLIIVPVIT